jgi:hypothetical protein
MMNQRAVFCSIAWSILLACSLGACASAPTHDAVAKFATATDATAENTRSAFAVVERAARMLEVEKRDNEFLQAPASVKLGPIPTQLTSDILEPRLKVLDALAGYASILSALTSGEQQAAFDKNAKALGENLKDVKSEKFNLPPGAADGVTKAVTALGDFLIKGVLDRDIPPIIRRMDKTVSDLADALVADVGFLRTLLVTDLTNYRIKRAENLTAIATPAGSSAPPSRLALYREYKQAVEDIDRFGTVDTTLAALQSALTKMKQAHAALVAPKSESAVQKVESFAAQAERVGKLADTLRKL